MGRFKLRQGGGFVPVLAEAGATCVSLSLGTLTAAGRASASAQAVWEDFTVEEKNIYLFNILKGHLPISFEAIGLKS